MIDLFVSDKIDTQTIINLISNILKCNKNSIILQNAEDFGIIEIPKDILNVAKCLCVKNSINGHANILLQLYNTNIEENTLIEKIIENIDKYNFSCYVPIGDFDDFVHIKPNKSITYGFREESENDVFHFVSN